MPACSCSIKKAEPGAVTLSYDQKEEKLTVVVSVDGTVTTGQAEKGNVSIAVKVRLSLYRFVTGEWDRIYRGRLEDHSLTFPCNNRDNNFSFQQSEIADLDSVHLAGKDLVLLLKAYYEVGGDCGTAGGFNVWKRVGVKLTTATPPVFDDNTTGGAWGRGNTDAGWGKEAKNPADP